MATATTTKTCEDCHISELRERVGDGVGEVIDRFIDYCPLHAAAEDMREALGLYVLAVGNTGAIVDPVSVRAAYELARAALAKAEGRVSTGKVEPYVPNETTDATHLLAWARKAKAEGKA